MDLIQGVALFFSALGTVVLLGWDTFQNLKTITKAEIQQSRGNRTAKPIQKRRWLFLQSLNHG